MRPEIAGVLSIATLAQPLSEGRLRPPRVVSCIFNVLPSFQPLLRRALMRFRPLSRDPFMDIGRTVPEFRSVGLAESKEFHGFSVDKKNVFEIDGESTRLLFQYASKHVDMFPCDAAAYEQHHETFRADDSIDSAAHCHCELSSFQYFQVLDGSQSAGLVNTSAEPVLDARLTPQPPPRLPDD